MSNKVLLVEDNRVSAFCTKTNLESLGYICDTTDDAETSLQLFAENHYISILMDISLGDDLNGYDTTRKIRQMESQQKRKRCVIIALTGHAKKHVEKNCVAAGMDYVLEKPFSTEDFQKLVPSS